MNRKLELRNDGKAREHLPEASDGHGRPALGHEHVTAGAVFPLEGPQRAHLLTAELVHAGYAVLHAPHMDEPMREGDLIPGQSAQLGDAQAVPEGDQDHGGVAQALPATALPLASADAGTARISLDLPRVSFHALRHTHASALIAAGLDVVLISRRLGHANAAVTLSVYGHLFKRDDSAAASAMEAAMKRTRSETSSS